MVGPKTSCTLIDAVITRLGQSDSLSRHTASLLQHPVAWERGDISWHHPIAGSLSSFWRPWQSASIRSATRSQCDLEKLAADFRQSSDRYKHTLSSLHTQVMALSACNYDSLQKMILMVASAAYPSTESASSPESGPPDFARKWQLWAQLKGVPGVSMHAILKRWRIWTQLMIISRQCRQASKHRRRQKLERIFEDARHAAKQHDIRSLYRSIRRLAPKKPKQRFKLKNNEGGHMTIKEEADHLLQHYKSIFADLPWAPVDKSMSHPVIASADIQDALASLPAWKSAPSHCLPNLLWKVFAPAVAERLRGVYVSAIQEQAIPSCWQDSWLFLLPKPGKRGHHARDLRPISLQDPAGKAILKRVTIEARSHCLHDLCALPLFAYLPMRGTAEAVHRVLSHCCQMEARCKSNTFSIHRLKSGEKTTELMGGVQLAIDITSAFDRVERSRLWRAMSDSGIPENLAAIIEHWHDQAHYHVDHSGLQRSVLTTRGVRQGCVCAPLLWVLYTRGWIHDLASLTGWCWLLSGLTIYADDVHCAWEITSERDFLEAVCGIRNVLQSLERIGLDVNRTKTVVLIRLVGKLSKKIRRQYIFKRKDTTS